MITKDGVTVAKEIELDDPVENMGAQMLKKLLPKLLTWPATELPPLQCLHSPLLPPA
jgi:hypothetical protein